jgi:hypothetical protein
MEEVKKVSIFSYQELLTKIKIILRRTIVELNKNLEVIWKYQGVSLPELTLVNLLKMIKIKNKVR